MSSLPLNFTNAPLLGPPDDKVTPCPWDHCHGYNQPKTGKYVGGLILELTRMAWGAGTNLVGEGVDQTIRWSPTSRDFSIDLEYNFSSSNKEYPCMIGIKLGDVSYSRIEGTNAQNRVGFADHLKGESYAKIGKGTANIIHVGQSNGQTVDMTDGTEFFFTVFGPVICSKYNFTTFGVVGRSGLSEYPAEIYGKSRFISSLQLGFTYEVKWFLNNESPALREIANISGQNILGRNTIKHSGMQ